MLLQTGGILHSSIHLLVMLLKINKIHYYIGIVTIGATRKGRVYYTYTHILHTLNTSDKKISSECTIQWSPQDENNVSIMAETMILKDIISHIFGKASGKVARIQLEGQYSKARLQKKYNQLMDTTQNNKEGQIHREQEI